MGNDNQTEPPRLPNGAPAALREFVACRQMSVELDTSDTSWLPMPDGVPGDAAPEVNLEPGPDSRSGKVRIGWGFISIEFPVRIVDGALVVDDAADLPFGIGSEIEIWVRRLNDQLAANDKALDEFRVEGDRLTITKRPVAAAPAGAATAAAGAATAPAAGDTPTPDDGAPPEGGRSGCLAWILGGIAALAAVIGIGVVATNGDDEAVSTPPASVSSPTTGSSTAGTTSTAAEPTATPMPVPEPTPEPTPEVAVGPADPCSPGPLEELPVGEYATVLDPCPDAIPIDYSACVPGPLCTEGQSPPFVQVGDPGVSHSGSGPDAVTGETGPSESTHTVTIGFAGSSLTIGLDGSSVPFDATAVQIVSDCGGTTVTGRADIGPDGTAALSHPLFAYGTCTAQGFSLVDANGTVVRSFPASLVGDGGSYEIESAEFAPTPPTNDGFTFTLPDVEDVPYWSEATWVDDATTVRNVLTAAPLPPECAWFFPPDALDRIVEVLDGCTPIGQYWVFAAALTEVQVEVMVTDTVIGHAGSVMLPIGFEPDASDLEAFATSGPLFDESIFPCGAGFVGVTVCPGDGGPMRAGGFVSVALALADQVPLEPDGTTRAHEVDFTSSGGGSYRVELASDGWSIDGPDGTRARAIVRGNSLTVVVPIDELPASDLGYILRTDVDGQVVEQPLVPVVGRGTTPVVLAEETSTEESTVAPPDSSAPATSTPGTTAPGAEVDEAAIVDFYAQLSAGLSSGDPTFPLARLHPLVLEAYPDQCPTALEAFVDPDFGVEVIEVGDTGPWTWELPDGRSFEVADAVTVSVAVSGRGQTGEPAEAHLAMVDGELRWFTFCT